jgi:hypothetical protein
VTEPDPAWERHLVAVLRNGHIEVQ